jgi:hypothetical protein
MVRILSNLRIDEVSSVDRGAGEGVRVMLMKRVAGPDYRAIFGKLDSPPGDQSTDDNAVPPRLEGFAAALMAANPALSREEALDHLMHSPRGRRLAQHLADITKANQAKEAAMTNKIDGLRDIAKQFGVVRLAKFIVDENSAHGISELEFFRLMQAEASTARRAGETDAQAFDRYFTSPGNVALRKAHAITKSGVNMMDVQPTQVGGADALDVDSDRSAAMEQLEKLAEEQRKLAPWMSTAQAFALVFQEPKNAEIAAKAHRRPAPTTSFAHPR